MNSYDEFKDCENCSHCQTINDDQDTYCHLQQRVVGEVCVKFEHYDGKQKPEGGARMSALDIEKEKRDFADWCKVPVSQRPDGSHDSAWVDQRWQGWLAAKRAAQPAVEATPVAWAVVSKLGGIHKLAITRTSADRKAAKWQEEWPNNQCRVLPLVFGDAAHVSGQGGEDAK